MTTALILMGGMGLVISAVLALASKIFYVYVDPKILAVEDEELGIRWLVHPYLYHITDRDRIRTDWEHLETRWVLPEEIGDYTTVPCLKETLDSVYAD